MNIVVRPIRTIAALVATLAVTLATLIGFTAQAPAATPTSCTVRWGSLPKDGGLAMTSAALTGVRAGRHACFDRLVIDLNGGVAGYDVRYVPLVHADGSGMPLPVAGAADLQVIVRAPAHNSAGRPSYTPSNPNALVNVSGYSTLRQVRWAGSFEGQSTIALGVRARLPMRVFVLTGPGNGSRLVIDVAHRW
ncbi:AMIN-like domain-containing (lipo)protein [Aestuariimicrobium ganziense]|uniref:AMIN-like domain-containing (lipo)protein n=1 Tax=Aestuariimicrobium ganziense TaxID=2773677 RepID=UPI0019438C88|nr:hypothetical protein [Aestuariimicrobium ganziense]